MLEQLERRRYNWLHNCTDSSLYSKKRSAMCTTSPSSSNPFHVFNERVVIAMVGLPARGKSFLSQTIVRYMNYCGCPTRIFNAGNLRRRDGLAGTDAAFFDASNQGAKDLREALAMECLEAAIEWIQEPLMGCSIGILDATNTTVARRRKVIDRIKEVYEADPCVKLIFVESITNDKAILENNYRMKLANDDYQGKDAEVALTDFRKRVEAYEAVYETICEDTDGNDIRYIKLLNAGEKLITKNIEGFLLRRVQRLLGSVHLWPRTIWISLVGETENDLKGVLGGDPCLSEAGLEYTKGLRDLIAEREKECDTTFGEPGIGKVVIYTGTNRRYVTSGEILFSKKENRKSLAKSVAGFSFFTPERQLLNFGTINDINVGLLDSLSEKETEVRFPEEVQKRKLDKLNYRYPGTGGESYQDLISRCGELVCMLEQSRGNSLLVCDRAVFRVVAAYFLGKSSEEIPHMEVSGVLELSRNENGFTPKTLEVSVGRATTSRGAGTVLSAP